MKTYIGVKIVQAEPCTLGAYNTRRGWKIPADEDPQRAGYFLRYPDGYQSWSPREIFEGAYRLVSDDERALVLPGKPVGSFYDRLLAEGKELEGRIDKLADFINGPEYQRLPERQCVLLANQLTAMRGYRDILQERIADIAAGQSQLAPVGEAIDENVRVTGGGHSETPIPFSG